MVVVLGKDMLEMLATTMMILYGGTAVLTLEVMDSSTMKRMLYPLGRLETMMLL